MSKISSSLQQSWWQLTTIQIGGAICMPLLLVGQQLVRLYGFSTAVFAIIVGNLLLLGLALIKSSLAYKNKKNTIENALDYFGNIGSLLMGITMLSACTGWFAIQLHIVGMSALHFFPALIQSNIYISSLCIILFGILMTGFSLYGLKGIAKFSDYTMPLLIVSIVYGLVKASYLPVHHTKDSTFSLASIAFVMASTLLVVIDIPTYYRVSRSFKDSLLSVAILYLIATPCIQIGGAYIGYHSSETDIIKVLTVHSGLFWQIFIIFFLILAGWTTNNTNMYSSVVTLKTLIPSLSQPAATLLIGSIGTICALFPLITHYEKVLSAMGILVASMGAIIAANYLWETILGHRITLQLQLGNSVAWICGIFFGFLSFTNMFTISNSALCDTFLIASLCAVINCLLEYLYTKKENIL